MEDMGGLEVLKQLRAMQAEARVVVVSADVQRTTVQLVAESGAVRFLGKPVTAEGLLDCVRAALAESSP